ncbi:MAG: mechanosensitive ion channel domain-containing protein [Synechococcaceae cyanobacterium]|nr:mechanosensitive ion channel domain-containing protein [Synechococcaceae cyanobacterium]
MTQLLPLMDTWLGYLQRPVVTVQLVLALGILLAVKQWWPRGLRLPQRTVPVPALQLSGLTLLALVLAGLGKPWGLVLLIEALVAGWSGLGGLLLALRPLLPRRERQRLESRLLRPMFLVLTVLLLLSQAENLAVLAVLPLGEWSGNLVTLGEATQTVLLIYLLLMGTGPPAEAIAWVLQRFLHNSDSSRRGMALVVRYLVVSVGILWALHHIGFNSTALLAVAGGLSVGLGFGVKEVFANFVSGLWLLFEGSVRPGEVLFIEGEPCEVRSQGLRATLLWRDRDNAELVVPNQTFFTMTTTTYTASDRLRRSEVRIGAAYRHDPREVIGLLESTAAEVARVLPHPAARGLVLEFGDSAIVYSLRYWIDNPMDAVSINSDVNQAIWQAFRAHGIEIPYPHQVQLSPPAGERRDSPSRQGGRPPQTGG